MRFMHHTLLHLIPLYGSLLFPPVSPLDLSLGWRVGNNSFFQLTNVLRWIFEKYDGLRAIWNCASRVVYSRWAKEIPLLPSILDSLPSSLWLDGEISPLPFSLLFIYLTLLYIWFGRHKGTRYKAIKLSQVPPPSSVSPSPSLFPLPPSLPLLPLLPTPFPSPNKYTTFMLHIYGTHKVQSSQLCVTNDGTEISSTFGGMEAI